MLDKVRQFFSNLKSDLKVLWLRNAGIIIIASVVFVFLKFRDLLLDIFIGSAKRLFKQTEQKSDQLGEQEKQLSSQGDALQKQANDLPSTEQPVAPDWYKKE